MQVLHVTSRGEGSSAWTTPGHQGEGGGGVKKWPKSGHVVYGRPFTEYTRHFLETTFPDSWDLKMRRFVEISS